MSFRPNLTERFVSPDGRLTIEGLRVLQGVFDRLDAIAAVNGPTGGATVDAEARAAIDAIIAGAE